MRKSDREPDNKAWRKKTALVQSFGMMYHRHIIANTILGGSRIQEGTRPVQNELLRCSTTEKGLTMGIASVFAALCA